MEVLRSSILWDWLVFMRLFSQRVLGAHVIRWSGGPFLRRQTKEALQLWSDQPTQGWQQDINITVLETQQVLCEGYRYQIVFIQILQPGGNSANFDRCYSCRSLTL